MQKKIIALAVAGLVSGAAFAQSNVQVFGIMDIGYQYSWSANDSNTKDKSEIKAGGRDGSRFGFRGTEDLGNGLKVNFEMAAGYNGDTGTNSDYGNGGLMSEGAWVGLSGDKWGSVKGGYFGSFIDDATGVDVTGRTGIGNSGLIGTGKYANFVAYYSPIWSGFGFKAGYSSNAIGQDKAMTPLSSNVDAKGNLNLNLRTYTVEADYKNGGLDLRAAYAQYDPAEVDSTSRANLYNADNGNEWLVGAAYDFKVASVSVMYQSQKNIQVGKNFGLDNFNGQNDMNDYIDTNVGSAIDTRDQWALGVKVPFGAKDSVALGYAQVKNKYYDGLGLGDSKAHNTTITYIHQLSKRTDVYALYSNVGSDDIGKSNIKAYSEGGYKNAFNVGLRHLF